MCHNVKKKRLLMGIFDIFKQKKPKLIDDIHAAAEWIAQAMNSSDYELNFSIDSVKEIDRFINDHSDNGDAKAGGLLEERIGSKLFAIGSYISVIFEKTYGAAIITDDNDPQGEINFSVKIGNNEFWPVQKTMKRFKNGNEDNLHNYVQLLIPK